MFGFVTSFVDGHYIRFMLNLCMHLVIKQQQQSMGDEQDKKLATNYVV
jgi:hypothetical protein